jgi:hypothetical protein
MKLFKNQTLTLFAISFILFSCETYYYYPVNQNVLKFEESGDISASLNAGEDYEGINIGYAFTNNIAFVSDVRIFGSNKAWGKRYDDYVWDNELILFKTIENYWQPAINIGYGYGEINRNLEYYDLSLHRFILQPSFGYKRKNYEIAFSSRFSRVNYDLIQLAEIPSNNYTFQQYFDFRDVGIAPFYFNEPAITLGVGWKYFKFKYQYSTLIRLSNHEIKYYSKGVHNFSLNFYLNRKQLFKNKE